MQTEKLGLAPTPNENRRAATPEQLSNSRSSAHTFAGSPAGHLRDLPLPLRGRHDERHFNRPQPDARIEGLPVPMVSPGPKRDVQPENRPPAEPPAEPPVGHPVRPATLDSGHPSGPLSSDIPATALVSAMMRANAAAASACIPGRTCWYTFIVNATFA